MCISHALSMPLSFWAAMNPEGRDKIISVTIVHLTAQQGENHYYCAEQIREKVKGKKKDTHSTCCDVALLLSRRKGENNSNKIILNEMENQFVNWLVQRMFTDQSSQLGNILWECKSSSFRPCQWDAGEIERAREGHNIGRISMRGDHMAESLNTHRNHILKVFFEENQQSSYCGIKQ